MALGLTAILYCYITLYIIYIAILYYIYAIAILYYILQLYYIDVIAIYILY